MRAFALVKRICAKFNKNICFLEAYGEEFAAHGAMFRGNPPQGKLVPLFPKYLNDCQRGLVQSFLFTEMQFKSKKILKVKGYKYFLNVLIIKEDPNDRWRIKKKVSLELEGVVQDGTLVTLFINMVCERLVYVEVSHI